MTLKIWVSIVLALCTLKSIAGETEGIDPESARVIAQQYMLVDTHIDVPYRLQEKWADVTVRAPGGDFDYERAREGGLDIPFMSIYTPASSEAKGDSFELANLLIDQVEALAGRAPDKFMLVRSSSDADRAFQRGLMGLALGMENGSPLEGKLENLQFFRDRGISYITLAHSKSNHISDSSFDKERRWNGLSPFGREVVAEMNRLGMMIDVSHLSDEAFFAVLEQSSAPVIASHSSARHFTPGWERNMSDEMIRALAAKGGVMQINFGSVFVSQKAREWYDAMTAARTEFLDSNGLDHAGTEALQFGKDYLQQHPLPYTTLDQLVSVFQHVIDLVGIEHVGIGSDFDGLGNTLPDGIKDVSAYPKLIHEFLMREYSVDDIRAVMGGNLMRVWREVERIGREQRMNRSE